MQGAFACHVDAVEADFEGDSRAEAVVYSGRYDDVLGGEHVSKLGGCGGTACGGGFHFVKSLPAWYTGVLICCWWLALYAWDEKAICVCRS